jgi:hypothetical protein
VDLVDARGLLHLPHGVDDPGMTAGGDDDQPAVLVHHTFVSTSRSTVGGALICADTGTRPMRERPPTANVPLATAPRTGTIVDS